MLRVAVWMNKLAAASVGLAVGAFLLKQSYVIVEPGERALIWDRVNGIREDKTWGEGLHFLIPFWQKFIKMNIRTTPKQIDSETGSKDLQTVSIGLRLLYKPDEKMLPRIAKNIGLDYDQVVLPSVGLEVLKSIVAQYNAGELITQRELVSQTIRQSLTERSADFNVILDDVSITRLGFSAEYTSAIEAKQVAQQEAERAKFVVQKSDQETKAAIIKAEGESQAATLVGEATQKYGHSFIELKRLEATKDISECFSKSKNVTYLPANNPIFIQARN